MTIDRALQNLRIGLRLRVVVTFVHHEDDAAREAMNESQSVANLHRLLRRLFDGTYGSSGLSHEPMTRTKLYRHIGLLMNVKARYCAFGMISHLCLEFFQSRERTLEIAEMNL